MNKARIKEEAEHFFEWPDPKRRDHVTLTSCLIFAEVIAGMAVDAEREACAQIGDGYDYGDRNCGDEIRARGNK
jgi:hypothetical protein